MNWRCSLFTPSYRSDVGRETVSDILRRPGKNAPGPKPGAAQAMLCTHLRQSLPSVRLNRRAGAEKLRETGTVWLHEWHAGGGVCVLLVCFFSVLPLSCVCRQMAVGMIQDNRVRVRRGRAKVSATVPQICRVISTGAGLLMPLSGACTLADRGFIHQYLKLRAVITMSIKHRIRSGLRLYPAEPTSVG